MEVAPDCLVDPRVVVEYDHLSRPEVVDVVADGPAIHTDGAVAKGPRLTNQVERAIQRHDAGRLAGEAEAIHGVAQIRAAERAEALEGSESHRGAAPGWPAA